MQWKEKRTHNLLATQRYMANAFMHRRSYLLAEPTSQAWGPCWDVSIITLSYCAPHSGTLRAIWSGGNASSANQVPPDPSPPPVPSATTTPIQMPAPGLGSPSPSVQNGEPGNYPQDGSPKGEISSGPRQSASSYSSATYSQFLKRASTSQSMETTGGSSKGGGKSQAPTNLPTRYSGESLRYRKAVIGLYTGDTSQALRTPQMPPHGDATPLMSSSSTTLASLKSSPHSSQASDPTHPAKAASLKWLIQATGPGETEPNPQQGQPKRCKPPDGRQCERPIPQTADPVPEVPTPYPHNLTPIASPLRPHCLAKDHLRRWLPHHGQEALSGPTAPGQPQRERVKDTMLRAADKLTPGSSKRKKWQPYTPDFISAVRQQMDLNDPLNAAVFACLTTCFYASARLGEFTVRTLQSFNPNMHVTTRHLSYEQDRNNLKVTVLHLPRTKMAGNEGEDIYWASQEGDTNPTAALQNHLRVNQPSEASHLFSYLLWGVPFDIMKAKGRWAGDSFLLYLRKHAVIIAPYIQAKPAIHESFI